MTPAPPEFQENIKTVENAFREVFIIEDEGIIKLVLASVVAHRLKADPLWIFLVASSSSGKTEFITSLNEVQGLYPISSLTSHTFISGMKVKGGGEVNLLDRMKNGIMSFKDFTSILSTNPEARGEIMGQLREIYDGEYSKDFGTGERKRWKGKIGLIAGVTTKIYTTQELYAAMGERFVMYAFKQPNQKEIGRRAITNTRTGMKDKRLYLQNITKEYLDNFIQIPADLPKLETGLENDLIDLAEFSTRSRSPIERDWRSPNKDITFKHDPEGIARFLTQLVTLASALQIMNGGHELLPMDKRILYKISLDSINRTRRICLQALTKYRRIDTRALAMKLGYPTSSIRRFLEDLNALDVIQRAKGVHNADTWNLKPSYRQLMAKFEAIEPTDDDLTEARYYLEEEPDALIPFDADDLDVATQLHADEIIPDDNSSSLL